MYGQSLGEWWASNSSLSASSPMETRMVLTPLRNDVRLYEGNIADQGHSLKSLRMSLEKTLRQDKEKEEL